MPVSGSYSVKFDFNFSGNGTLCATLNQGAEDSYATRAQTAQILMNFLSR